MANDFGNLDLEKRWMRFTQMRLRLARKAATALKDYHAIREFFTRAEAVRTSNAALAQTDRHFEKTFGPNPSLQHLEQTNPNRMNDLLDRFQDVLAGMALPGKE